MRPRGIRAGGSPASVAGEPLGEVARPERVGVLQRAEHVRSGIPARHAGVAGDPPDRDADRHDCGYKHPAGWARKPGCDITRTASGAWSSGDISGHAAMRVLASLASCMNEP